MGRLFSEITVAELKYGAELGRRKGLRHRTQNLDEFVSAIKDVFDMFASEKARLRLVGTPMEDNFDLLIGCTSVIHRMVMITENLKDFKNISNIRLENWIRR